MSNKGSKLAIFGAIFGFILLYFIVRGAVDQLQTDQHTLKEYGVATVQELQMLGAEGAEAIEEAEAEAVAAEDEAVDEAEAIAEQAIAESEQEVESVVVEEEMAGAESDTSATSETGTAGNGGQGQGRQGQGGQGQGGGGSGLQTLHMAPIPAEYAGLMSTVAVDSESLERGKAHFDLLCATCHGPEGLGDGPAAAALDPTPPMIAQTSLMTGDDYLIWRISEGGAMAPFNSAMPAWKETLDEQARWDTINYVRSLGGMNGADAGTMREEMQATMQAEMLASGMALGVIDQDEADTFSDVHGRLDAYRLSLGDAFTGNMDEMQDELLAGMVEAEQLTQTEADAFADIHARLDEAGVMQ